jgi:hypothetical protein
MADDDGVRPADVQRHIERILSEESRLLGSLEQLLRSEAEVCGDGRRSSTSARHSASALSGLGRACRPAACSAAARGLRNAGAIRAQPALRLAFDLARRCRDLNAAARSSPRA